MTRPTLEQLTQEATETANMRSAAAKLRTLYPLIEQLMDYYSLEKIREALIAGGVEVNSPTGFKTALYRARDTMKK